MTSDRKESTAGFWITVALVAVLVGYPLSFGPWIWCAGVLDPPPSIRSIGKTIFLPLRELCRKDEMPKLYRAYLDWWLVAVESYQQEKIQRIEREAVGR
jgi:hypothetical protein